MTLKTRYLIRAFFALLALASTCLVPADEADITQQWIVLPDELAIRGTAASDSTVVAKTAQDSKLKQAGDIEDDWVPVEYDGEKGYVPEALVLRHIEPETDEKGDLPIGKEVVDRDTPLPLDYKPSDLLAIDKRWDYHTDGTKRMRKAAAKAINKMFSAAHSDNVHLRVVSAYRPALQQRYLYLRKIDKSGLKQQLVAKPGHSEHQLGTTIDVSGLDPKTVLKTDFAETREGKWLKNNTGKFGFRFTYTEATEEKTGFKPEPWHIRYMGEPEDEPEPALPSR